jgi:hypothetical protein
MRYGDLRRPVSWAATVACLAAFVATPAIEAQESGTATVDGGFVPSPDGGLLRLRDLTPFDLLRLDLRPPNEQALQGGDWVFEFDLSYQNTFAMSRNVRDYLEERGVGRMPLAPADVAAIHALPGDAFYIDGEFGRFEFTVHRRLGERWSASLTIPYLAYTAGVLDGLIENVHDAFSFGQQGRDLVARHRFQVVYDIGGLEFGELSRASAGGLADPVLILRHQPRDDWLGWRPVLEAAVKFAVASERNWLSTGRSDYGVQAALQRAFGPNALHVAGSLVYYAGHRNTPTARGRYVPTLIVGYGRRLAPRTSVVLQGYASESAVTASDIPEFADNKYLLSLGFRFHARKLHWSVAVTENVGNFHNTPDIGAQLDIVYRP